MERRDKHRHYSSSKPHCPAPYDRPQSGSDYWKTMYLRTEAARKEGWARFFRSQEREDFLLSIIALLDQADLPDNVNTMINKAIGHLNSQQRTCPYCRKPVQFGDSTLSACAHRYHHECLERIREDHVPCKVCRAESP